MLLGKESQWSVALEIQEPSRSIHGKTQRSARIPQEKSESRDEVNHFAGEEECCRVGKLSCHLRQPKAGKLIYSFE